MTISYEDTAHTVIRTIGDVEFVIIPSQVTSILANAAIDSTIINSITFESGSQLIKLDVYSLASPCVKQILMQECIYLTYISQWCFNGCRCLEKIEFPQNGNLKIIKQGAFAYCVSLKEIKFPQTIEIFEHCTITNGAIFHECSALKNVVFLGQSKVKQLGDVMFWLCTSLDHVVIPKKINHLPKEVFSGCTSLREVVFLNPNPSFDENPFKDLDLFSIHIYVTSAFSKQQFHEHGFSYDEISIIFVHSLIERPRRRLSLSFVCFLLNKF